MNTTEGSTIISDDCVFLIWLDPYDNKEVSVTPDWLEQNGTPYDGISDQDMTYLRTEISNKAVLQLLRKELING